MNILVLNFISQNIVQCEKRLQSTGFITVIVSYCEFMLVSLSNKSKSSQSNIFIGKTDIAHRQLQIDGTFNKKGLRYYPNIGLPEINLVNITYI